MKKHILTFAFLIFSFSSFAFVRTAFSQIFLEQIVELERSNKNSSFAYILKNDPCIYISYNDNEKKYCTVSNRNMIADYPFAYATGLKLKDNVLMFVLTSGVYDLYCKINIKTQHSECSSERSFISK